MDGMKPLQFVVNLDKDVDLCFSNLQGSRFEDARPVEI